VTVQVALAASDAAPLQVSVVVVKVAPGVVGVEFIVIFVEKLPLAA
jgi:hypothetical protein